MGRGNGIMEGGREALFRKGELKVFWELLIVEEGLRGVVSTLVWKGRHH